MEKGQAAVGACCSGTKSEFRDPRSLLRRGGPLPESYGRSGDGQLSWDGNIVFLTQEIAQPKVEKQEIALLLKN